MAETITTPPTITVRTLYFNPCSPVSVEGCAEDDHLCVIDEIKFADTDKTMVARVKDFGSASAGAKETLDTRQGTVLTYDGASWGEKKLFASAKIQCGNGDNSFFTHDSQLQLTIGKGVLCPDEDDEPPATKPPGKGNKAPASGGWGFFHWFFMLLILGTVVYAVLTVYVNFAQSKGNLPLAADIGDVLRDLPYLLRDVMRKVKSSFSGQTRSGYSAL